MMAYINLHVLKPNDKKTFLQKRNRKIKDFIEQNNPKGRRIFVIVIGATIITAFIFTVMGYLVFASEEGVVSTLIVTLICVAIIYWIGSKFVKSLAYQLFDKRH